MGVTTGVAGGPAATGDLGLGREAFARRSWAAARDHLTRADPATLGAQDWHSLGTAAYLAGDRHTAVRAWQQAFTLHNGAGEHVAAAMDAYWVAYVHNTTGNQAVGGGWVARALRLLEGEPDDAEPRGFLAIHEFHRHLAAGDLVAATDCGRRALAIGQRWGNGDLTAFGLVSQGRMLIYTGRVPEGLALLDEAMACLTAGEVSAIGAGNIYCAMIEGCQEISDFRRMTEWTEALTRWCVEQPDLVPFTGQCAVHRGQILRAHGSFGEALEELDRAAERYAADGMDPAVGVALHERGEVLRALGDLDGADAAYARAAAYGVEPQPGQSLLWLARGRTAAALASARRLASEPADPVARSRRLPGIVEILLAAGELAQARAVADDLVDLASAFGCEALSATGAYWAGTVTLAEGDAASALPQLRRAWKAWIDLGARYDAAWARARIGLALRALADEDSTASELAVAARTFAELGAQPARQAVAAWMAPASLPDGLTAREVEVLRLVAGGHSNPQVAAALFLSEKTVARHLSNIFAKTGATSRTAAVTYAHQHDLV